jgi:hypothetical protein
VVQAAWKLIPCRFNLQFEAALIQSAMLVHALQGCKRTFSSRNGRVAPQQAQQPNKILLHSLCTPVHSL